MKQFFLGLLTAAIVIIVGACGTPPTTNPDGTQVTTVQRAIDTTTVSYNALDAAIVQATAAVKQGTLKGQDARNALDGFTKAKTGLDLALVTLRAAQAATPPASGAKP